MSEPVEFRGDELDLYGEFHFELVRKVERRVNTSRENVDDACAFAWMQFFKHQPDRDGEWKGWLYRVATRRAFALDRLDRRDVDLVDDLGHDIELEDPRDRHGERDEFIAAVQELQRLPLRLQRLVLLRSQVETQQELADRVGLSHGRVSVLLAKVARLVDARSARSAQPEPALPPRAARLRELETDPPEWLVKAIGRPGANKSPSALVLAWRRTALLIDDYRRRSGQRSASDAIGPTPLDRDARRAHRRAEQAIQDMAEFRAGQSRTRSR
jgi:RNA polymerase sigma factor (sigma-70 family)